ncbi:MAG: GNAT family N-acetyltransferase [Actinomycetota bacterium]|nr:GNAT family N-acetyltransferase [Actinomycetota bacterium]
MAALNPGKGDEIIAVVRYASEAGDGRAKYAAVVEDGWQGRGLGPALTERLIEAARERGIRCLYALVTPETSACCVCFGDSGCPVGRDVRGVPSASRSTSWAKTALSETAPGSNGGASGVWALP